MFESHTPYEWRLQIARSIVDPWGDDRADSRAQINTSQLMSQHTDDESVKTAIADAMARYYGTEPDEPDNLEVDQAALNDLPQMERTREQ